AGREGSAALAARRGDARAARALAQRVQPPLAGDPLQRVLAAIVELEARARDKILDGRGHEHLTRVRTRRDACADVQRDSGELVADLLALTGVHAASHLEAELADALRDRAGAHDRAGRPVERREEAVAGVVELAPA